MSGMDKEHYAAWREGYDRGRDEWADARAKGLPSKSELIRRALATNPDQPAASIAREVGCTPALVSLVKKKLERATLAAEKEALEARVRELEAALHQLVEAIEARKEVRAVDTALVRQAAYARAALAP